MPVAQYEVQPLFAEPIFRADLGRTVSEEQIAYIRSLKMVPNESNLITENTYIFELPQLARLTMEDQIFVAAFLKSHGSIKEMEQVFGVSYPTVKARLNRIAGQLEFVDTNPAPLEPGRNEILGRLERGEITAAEAIRQLEVP